MNGVSVPIKSRLSWAIELIAPEPVSTLKDYVKYFLFERAYRHHVHELLTELATSTEADDNPHGMDTKNKIVEFPENRLPASRFSKLIALMAHLQASNMTSHAGYIEAWMPREEVAALTGILKDLGLPTNARIHFVDQHSGQRIKVVTALPVSEFEKKDLSLFRGAAEETGPCFGLIASLAVEPSIDLSEARYLGLSIVVFTQSSEGELLPTLHRLALMCKRKLNFKHYMMRNSNTVVLHRRLWIRRFRALQKQKYRWIGDEDTVHETHNSLLTRARAKRRTKRFARVVGYAPQGARRNFLDIYDLSEQSNWARNSKIDVQRGEQFLYGLNDICVNDRGHIFRADGQMSFGRSRFRPRVTQANSSLKRAFYLPTFNTHHSHMICESISLLHFRDQIDDDVVFLCHSVLTDAQLDYLTAVGIDKQKIRRLKPDETVLCEELYTVSGKPHNYTERALGFLASVAPENSFETTNNATAVPIYITRRDARVYRNLVNEKEVEHIFQSFGFHVHRTSDYSALEKIQLVRNASVIAGPLGAAFHLSAFTRSKQILYISPPTYKTPELLPIWAVNRHRVFHFEAAPLAQWDAWQGLHSSFYLHPEILRRGLERFLQKTPR